MENIRFNIDIEDDHESLNKSICINESQKNAFLDKFGFVDLDLPSGTLWCKYNFGVDPNNLKTPIDWAGKYIAWGELEEKKDYYGWNTYKYNDYWGNDKPERNITKYCNDETWGSNGFRDDITILQPEDDIVQQNSKELTLCIPSKEQFEELFEYTICSWVKDYQGIEGLKGRIYKCKKNHDKQIFFPAAGYSIYGNNQSAKINTKFGKFGKEAFYWTTNLDLECSWRAYSFHFRKIKKGHGNWFRLGRYTGCCIRPILK